MLPGITVFSTDATVREGFAAQIAEALGSPDGIHTAETAAQARDQLQKNPLSLLFLDARHENWNPETELFLAWLPTREMRPFHLITLTDRWLPMEWAAILDLYESATLEFPCSWESLDRLLDPVRDGGKLPPPRVPPTLHEICSDKIRFATYTPNLFPVIDQIRRVSAHDVTLLLIGETGTGKTTLAQLIHGLSQRKTEPFQNVACGAMPAELIESELFGHVRGAFTSADRSRIGRFEAAGKGTLLLDEIDVLGVKEQSKLLRVLETGEYEPVGSTETRFSTARLVVASNVDLETLATQNKFRSDLYYRLNVLQFHLPPLRDRPLDLVSLALNFLRESSTRHGIRIDRVHRDFLQAIKRYAWPGNLRELKNQLQRSVLFCDQGGLGPEHLSPAITNGSHGSANGHSHGQSAPSWSLAEQVAKSERQILEEALRANDFKRTATARYLGITRVGLYKKMRRHGLLDMDAKST